MSAEANYSENHYFCRYNTTVTYNEKELYHVISGVIITFHTVTFFLRQQE